MSIPNDARIVCLDASGSLAWLRLAIVGTCNQLTIDSVSLHPFGILCSSSECLHPLSPLASPLQILALMKHTGCLLYM